jgi:DNA gyrase subunit B
MGRDRRTQAILPLRGKILNIERARLDRMLASEQIKNLVVALGTAIGDTFDITKLRYHKIILATDADVDGAHIRTLLLTLLYRFFRPLIDAGYVYIAQPPLFKIKRGKEIIYVYTDEERSKITTGPNDDVQRYKGLGEMNAEQLWETTMDPKARILKQVAIDDAREADRIFDILMGSDVPSRKSFIQSNAKKAVLDV